MDNDEYPVFTCSPFTFDPHYFEHPEEYIMRFGLHADSSLHKIWEEDSNYFLKLANGNKGLTKRSLKDPHYTPTNDLEFTVSLLFCYLEKYHK